MAAPATPILWSYVFRDAKGNTSRMKMILGAADNAVNTVNANVLKAHLAAISNAHVDDANDAAPINKRIYGTSGEYDTVEDKAVLTFTDDIGNLHRYQVPAPKAAIFSADQETVNPANAAVASVITDMSTFAYGNYNSASPLVYIGGVRLRRRMQRKVNIFIKDPTLAEPAE